MTRKKTKSKHREAQDELAIDMYTCTTGDGVSGRRMLSVERCSTSSHSRISHSRLQTRSISIQAIEVIGRCQMSLTK